MSKLSVSKKKRDTIKEVDIGTQYTQRLASRRREGDATKEMMSWEIEE